MATTLFDPRDLARVEQTVKFWKEVADLSNKMGAKKLKKPFNPKKGARQTYKQSKDGSRTGDRTGIDRQTEKEESSDKKKSPRSTPAAKKGGARGKGKLVCGDLQPASVG